MSFKNDLHEKKSYPKVLFTTGLPWTFRASNIAHLYEISQSYPVILLSEKLDPETEKVLHNKELFPKLEKIIPYRQFTGRKTNLFSLSRNYYYYKLAKDVIEQYKPDILIAGDTHLFQLYLSRFAKKMKPVLHLTIQGGMRWKMEEIRLWSYLTSAYLKIPSFLPLRIRLFLTKCKKYLGHFLYFWILPLTVGQLPFRGKSSFILKKGDDGLRASDYSIVYSNRDYHLAIENGVPAEKIYILAHPLIRKKTREFFEKTFFRSKIKYKTKKKVATLMLTDEPIGFRRKTLSLVSKEERKRKRLEIIDLIAKILKDWKIFIKPHPDTKNFQEIKKELEGVANNIEVVDPLDPADEYIGLSEVIIELPRSGSTILFSASLQCPEKPIISLDLHHELLGNIYKNFDGVEYVDNKEKFISLLKEIQNNKFHKKRYKARKKLEPNEFSNMIELLEYLIDKKLR